MLPCSKNYFFCKTKSCVFDGSHAEKEAVVNHSAQAIRTTHLFRPFSIIAAILLAILTINPDIQAQTDPPKVEIGGHFSLLRLPMNRQGFDKTAPGGGVRATFNLNGALALEGEVNYYPEINPIPQIVESKALTGLFGVKAGWRSDKIGIFGKVRPGLLRYEEEIDPRIIFITPPPVPQNPHFALDLGGVLELYPSRRLVVRFDVGDTAIRFRYRSPLSGEIRFTEHNLQFNVGIGVRFF